MNNTEDIRWRQRFENYQKALAKLTIFIEEESLNEMEEQGLIQAFEYTYELAWKLLKDFLEYQGIQSIIGSRDAIGHAFQNGLIENGEKWMEMLKDRNRTSHVYDEKIAKEIGEKIKTSYYFLFLKLKEKMQKF